MKMKKMKNKLTWISIVSVMILTTDTVWSSSSVPAAGGDRAVEIAKQARDRIEDSSKHVKESSEVLFKKFAKKTAEMQKLIDTRKQLKQAGLLKKEDPTGDARRAHINGRILEEVGQLKKVSDEHLTDLLDALAGFDEAVADSLADTQATRSINSNYETSLDRYIKREKGRFNEAEGKARQILDEIQKVKDPYERKRLMKRYTRAKKRIQGIEQRRKLYKARLKVAAINQKISDLIRRKIRTDGNDISSDFRNVLADLYICYAKVIPVAENGGTSGFAVMDNLGFANVEEFRNVLSVVSAATNKLSGVLDEMVGEVMTGLDEIKVVGDQKLTGEVLSVEEEMDFLRKQRQKWNS